MKYNLHQIMSRAWELRKTRSFTICTALKLAWSEAKGVKRYTFNVESERAGITAYIVKAIREGLEDIHQQHKVEALRAALLASCDRLGVAVLDGKTVGLCKYALRNAA